MKRMIVVAALTLFALPAMAADAAACEKFVKSLGKALKIATKKDMDADSASFWKTACAKRPDADIAKDTACFDKVKNEADANACMK